MGKITSPIHTVKSYPFTHLVVEIFIDKAHLIQYIYKYVLQTDLFIIFCTIR